MQVTGLSCSKKVHQTPESNSSTTAGASKGASAVCSTHCLWKLLSGIQTTFVRNADGTVEAAGLTLAVALLSKGDAAHRGSNATVAALAQRVCGGTAHNATSTIASATGIMRMLALQLHSR